MAASSQSRVPKLGRNLLRTMAWFVIGASAIVLAARFISGDTMEHQRQEDEAAKKVQSLAQSSQASPASIAAMYDNQRTGGMPGVTAAEPGSQSTQPQGATGTAAGTQGASGTNSRDAGRPATPAGRSGTAENPQLRMPPDRPPAASGRVDADDGMNGSSNGIGGPMTPQRARLAGRSSEIAAYEDSGDTHLAGPTTNPAALLAEQLKTIQLQSGSPAGDRMMAEYVKTLQTQASAAQARPQPGQKSGSVEWINAQQSQQDQDQQPLRPTVIVSEYMVFEGTPIRIALLRDINSDLPGEFEAMVTRDVYDSLGYQHKLIPWGTMLRGRYNSEIVPGQSRLLFAFQSLRFRNGAKILLRGMPGSDLGGAAGAAAEVDTHFWKIFGSSLAVGSVAAIASRATSGGSNVTINLGGTSNTGGAVATQALSDVVKQMLSRNENIKDTLSLKKGEELTVVINRDLDLPPSVTGVEQAN